MGGSVFSLFIQVLGSYVPTKNRLFCNSKLEIWALIWLLVFCLVEKNQCKEIYLMMDSYGNLQ